MDDIMMEALAAQQATETVQAKVERLYKEQEAELAELRSIEERRKRERLAPLVYATMLALQDSIALRITELAEAEAQAKYDAADTAVTQVSVTHDRGVQQTRQGFTRLCNAICDMYEAISDLEEHLDEQLTPLYMLQAPDGQPAFPELSMSARSITERFILGLPQGGHLLLYLFEPTSHRPSVGEFQRALDPCPGVKPLSQRLVERFLQRWREALPLRQEENHGNL